MATNTVKVISSADAIVSISAWYALLHAAMGLMHCKTKNLSLYATYTLPAEHMAYMYAALQHKDIHSLVEQMFERNAWSL